MARGRIAGRLALSLVGVLVALVGLELFARVLEDVPMLPLVPRAPYIDNAILYRESPTRLYELRPGVHDVVGNPPVDTRINGGGFRDDEEIPVAKPAGTIRIALLGDSFTFAGKVVFAETLGERLEKLLDAADGSRRHQVLNFGVGGYNTTQEALQLEEQVLPYEPDLVVVAYFLNDATGMTQAYPKHPRVPLGARLVLKRSALVQIAYRIAKMLEARRKGKPMGTARDYPDLVEGSPGWADSKAALRKIRDLARTRGVPAVVMMWPLLTDLDDHYPLADKHDLVRRACAELGMPFVDLLAALRGREATALWVSPHDMHPNSQAQAIAAQALFDELQALDWNGRAPR